MIYEKTQLSYSSLFSDSDKEDTDYWQSKSIEERFKALELLRQRFYCYDESTQRFQRILEYSKLK